MYICLARIKKPLRKTILIIPFFLWPLFLFSQKAYFIDGYHGGVWGHYPDWNTRFMVDMLQKNPNWKINIEIEPDTWDTTSVKDPAAYNDFKNIFSDQSVKGTIEYVKPTYGQSYLYNISGESIIRQFYYGMKKLREHFPTAVFTSYSSEEPCFTSALPQVLKSYGFKYASLKNPNTCWGGYTRAFGGELVNWVGPDNTKLITVPRYQVEGLLPNSTWQTTSYNNSKEYVSTALQAGITNPVGMCLQDAGWRNGPWLGDGTKGYQPTEYKTWRDYIQNFSIKVPVQDWKVSQEDMQVSLVWGSQILQKLAQQVRTAENKVVVAEKIAAISSVYKKMPWPAKAFQQAWRPLLLSQHHDCWIVPYNRKHTTNWAGYVAIWTGITNQKSDSIIQQSVMALADVSTGGTGKYVRVFNTTGGKRNELVTVTLPADWDGVMVKTIGSGSKEISSQVVTNSKSGQKEILFRAEVPSMGYNTYQLVKSKPSIAKATTVFKQANGTYKFESDLYKIIIDPSKGGVITSLVAKTLGNKEFVDQKNERGFNELRGNFYKDGGFHSSKDHPATIDVIENGPARIKAAIHGNIGGHPFTQWLILAQGQKRIDFSVRINWNGNPGIGNDYAQTVAWEPKNYRKAFYDDRDKLLLLFPSNLAGQKVYKNAPFDVTESKLENTFFTSWDSIKNNILLNWVDISDASNAYGLALLTDHTTNYTHGKDHPLGLTLQYSGIGLWGRNYSITAPLEVNYALIPHKGKWDNGGVWTEGEKWNEPLAPTMMDSPPAAGDISKSLINITGSGLQVSALTFEGNDLLVRLFNAEGDNTARKISFDTNIDTIQLVELNGEKKEDLKVTKDADSRSSVEIAMPRFGFRTIRLPGVGG